MTLQLTLPTMDGRDARRTLADGPTIGPDGGPFDALAACDGQHGPVYGPSAPGRDGAADGQRELPLLECPDCDSWFTVIPRLWHCAAVCVECNTKWEFENGILNPIYAVPQAKVEVKSFTRLHIASMQIEKVEIKTPRENTSECIGCGDTLNGFSVRVSRFSHVGKRDIVENKYPYLTKTVYFPVYVKGRMCDTCCDTLRPDVKAIGSGNDEKVIGIWRDTDNREVNILIETERNTSLDNQSMKGMNLEIKGNREPDTRESYKLMRIKGLDEPIVLSFDPKFKTPNGGVDARAYNALFGKRQVNRYGRQVFDK